jgi:Nucleotidyltransferase domain
MHIYAFGSICRGEIEKDSDIDLLAIVESQKPLLDPSKYSIYSHSKIATLWRAGSPFAWHLFLEARLPFSSNGQDFLKALSTPAKYKRCLDDCQKFFDVYLSALNSLKNSPGSEIFDLSSMFLGIRNIAICFSLGVLEIPSFSRHVGLRLEGFPLPMTAKAYHVLERARILCSRSIGDKIRQNEIAQVLIEADEVTHWMKNLVDNVREHERVQ